MSCSIFGRRPVEPLVVLIVGHVRKFLDAESKARGKYGLGSAQFGERAIVESRAITDAIATGVEGEQRHRKNIRLNLGPIATRFGQTEPAWHKLRTCLEQMKIKRLAPPCHPRQRDAMPARAQHL